jgi:hypothetical protein
MVDVADRNKVMTTSSAEHAERKPLPRWVITLASVAVVLLL